jgi:carotenoid cleavage dioxygenase-like enzyme
VRRTNDISASYAKGFETLTAEVVLDSLAVKGKSPDWLQGTLLRNGPAGYGLKNRHLHWFDGLAMLHAFSIKGGKVAYANKYLQTHNYREVQETGKIAAPGFGADPCRTIFQRAMSLFQPLGYDNANVNISQLAGEFVAMTETPMPIKFDLPTLKTLGTFSFEDNLKGAATTAHPHFDFRLKSPINYLLEFSRISKYHLYALPPGGRKRQVIASVETREPAYMHSFGMTENYLLLAEFPLVVNPLKVLLSNQGFIRNYEWKPQRGTTFLAINKNDGRVKQWTSEAFFAFHHINAFESGDDIFLDISAYPDTRLIDAFYMDNLKAGKPVPTAEFRRYRLGAVSSSASYQVLGDQAIELPRINYKQANAQAYRFAYGCSFRQDRPGDFMNQLLKVDVVEDKSWVWLEDGCYPGEPVFVASPNAGGEDDGVLLSVVLDSHKGNSFLLVLDASSFAEVARAEVPHPVPFGFHGQFFAG